VISDRTDGDGRADWRNVRAVSPPVQRWLGAVIPTIGWFRRMLPVDPKNRESPKEKIPPSRATNQ
jgi:hypothetical protein